MKGRTTDGFRIDVVHDGKDAFREPSARVQIAAPSRLPVLSLFRRHGKHPLKATAQPDFIEGDEPRH